MVRLWPRLTACLRERLVLLLELLAAAARRVGVAAQRLEFDALRLRGGGELRPAWNLMGQCSKTNRAVND
jgi:hypothetical protein